MPRSLNSKKKYDTAVNFTGLQVTHIHIRVYVNYIQQYSWSTNRFESRSDEHIVETLGYGGHRGLRQLVCLHVDVNTVEVLRLVDRPQQPLDLSNLN
jgi:hypothetical protein